MKLNEKNFPNCVELMQKHLFQESAASIREAIAQYLQNGPESVAAVLRELEKLLIGNYSEVELTDFVEKYSDYLEAESGGQTLRLIQKILTHESRC